MISASHTFARPLRLLGLVLGLLVTLPSLHAHRAFEVSGLGRIQHGRLEFTVTISLVMANFLLRSPAKPEESVTAANFEEHREALLRLAPAFYSFNDGPAPLAPQKILLKLNTSGEPEFCFIYPLPVTGPLRISSSGLRTPGTEGSNLVRFYDDNDTALGAGLLGPAPGKAELSIPISVPVVSKP